VLSKRRLHRRLLQRLSSIEGDLGLEDGIHPSLLDETVCRWATSLPWVVELTDSVEEPLGRRFAIDCPVLDCRQPLFSLGTLDGELGPAGEVLVVLPEHLARRGSAAGWAAVIAELPGGRIVVGVALPTTIRELIAFQRLLGVAYAAAFPPVLPGA
jgi:hypothetical protein